jgi:cation-transporting ATPase E
MKNKQKKKAAQEPKALRRSAIPPLETPPETGLSRAQVEERLEGGWANTPVKSPTRSVGRIIRDNVLTYFNLVFTVLAVLVLIAGGVRDLLFYVTIVVNTLIGIIQELRSKKTLDSLSLVAAPKATAIRDGLEVSVPAAELVRDDVVVFSSGDQIYADAVVLTGDLQVNEALITGEADEIPKTPGSSLLSGSFVISGQCRARLTNVGPDSFASRLTLEAKRHQKATQSEMMSSLTKLVKVIGLIIIPIGIVLFLNQYLRLHMTWNDSVLKTVGALVGMIPEGLYLLTSIALAVSVIRLAQRRTLTHDLACIETLARVNILCVDKTGTITEPEMLVENVALLSPDRFIMSDVRMIMADHTAAHERDNETEKALAAYFNDAPMRRATGIIPFTSKTKYAGTIFEGDETYLIGAPEILLGERFPEYEAELEPYYETGCRLLMLVMYDGPLETDTPDGNKVLPIALIGITNKIRDNARETFDFFRRQGVRIKVISGDNARTVSGIALKAGVEGAEHYIDARELDSEDKLRDAAVRYTVFGRVTPEQKRQLIRALKAAGNTVAMTGDGVNDVLALKEADCSVAMASGSDVACQVSHIVLMDSDFASMPNVVAEGRRVINNIERSAALFLQKNIFSMIMALLSLAAGFMYPVEATQLSLFSTFAIGIPSFLLALEPSTGHVRGRFLRNVLLRAAPSGVAYVILLLGVIAFGEAFHIDKAQVSTICAMLLTVAGMVVVFRLCKPWTKLRRIMFWLLIAAIIFSCFFMRWWFRLETPTLSSLLILATFSLLTAPLIDWLYKLMDRALLALSRRKGKKAR